MNKKDIEKGKFYIKDSAIWAVDATDNTYAQVYIEDKILKVKTEQLIIVEDEENVRNERMGNRATKRSDS